MASIWRSLTIIACAGLFVIFTSAAFAASSCEPGSTEAGDAKDPNKDEIWPWPWGTECPFNWTNIQGRWELAAADLINYFEFEVLSVSEDGSRYFEVRRYNENGVLFSKGTGFSIAGERIVRAAMYTYDSETKKGDSYWVIVRSYKKHQQNSCRYKSQVTAITIRRHFNREDDDSHYVIQKVEAEQRAH